MEKVYDIVVGDDIRDLCKAVNRKYASEAGWHCVGGVFMVGDPNWALGCSYAQAMVYKSEE